LRKPWFGHTLGYWTEELEKEADLAVKGEHYLSGEKWSRRRKKA
jgi:hypothetical protein